MGMQQYDPPHPGLFIKRNYIDPFHLVSSDVAEKLKVSPSTLNRILNGKSSVTPEMALKLSKVIGRSPESWLLMQDSFNLWAAKKTVNLDELESIVFAI